MFWRISVGIQTGTATNGCIFEGITMFYDGAKEGGYMTTVHADKPRQLQMYTKQTATHQLTNKKDKRISTYEHFKCNQSNIEELYGI
jgi:hypothetical protein